MSYFGQDPGNVRRCEICGGYEWAGDRGAHDACESIWELRLQLARARAAIDPGYVPTIDLDQDDPWIQERQEEAIELLLSGPEPPPFDQETL